MNPISHIVIESNTAEHTHHVISRHRSEQAAQAAARAKNTRLHQRYPGGCMVSYSAMELWYGAEYQRTPRRGEIVALYSERTGTYARAMKAAES